jgi:predicted transcriptional regulator YdeE
MSTLISKGKVRHHGFQFLGTSAITSNQAEMNGEGCIPALWANFYQEQILDLIPNKKNSTILALYTQYESDETGPYTFAIGTEVTEKQTSTNKLAEFEVPEANYIVFTTRKGPVQEVVVEAWQEIWEWSKTNERAFQTDFELYDERAIDPTCGQVDIYISIK